MSYFSRLPTCHPEKAFTLVPKLPTLSTMNFSGWWFVLMIAISRTCTPICVYTSTCTCGSMRLKHRLSILFHGIGSGTKFFHRLFWKFYLDTHELVFCRLYYFGCLSYIFHLFMIFYLWCFARFGTICAI